jgi:AraC-like DNA-binding protein
MLAREHYKREVTYGLEAAFLFQPADFDEKGWLITTARNLQHLFDCITEIFPTLKFYSERRQDKFVCGWTPQQIPEFFVHFIAAASLIVLRGQGISATEITSVFLPEWSAPDKDSDMQHWQEHFHKTFQTKAYFQGSAIEIHLTAKAASVDFKTADEIMFKFFQSRCRNSNNRDAQQRENQDLDLLLAKIRTIILTHLEDSQFSFSDVADGLGLSIRSLERLLARHNHSLRKIKQDLQCSTATELLRIGMRPKQVASKIGFADPTAFSRAFLKWTGEAPSSFRERMCDAPC